MDEQTRQIWDRQAARLFDLISEAHATQERTAQIIARSRRLLEHLHHEHTRPVALHARCAESAQERRIGRHLT